MDITFSSECRNFEVENKKKLDHIKGSHKKLVVIQNTLKENDIDEK